MLAITYKTIRVFKFHTFNQFFITTHRFSLLFVRIKAMNKVAQITSKAPEVDTQTYNQLFLKDFSGELDSTSPRSSIHFPLTCVVFSLACSTCSNAQTSLQNTFSHGFVL